MTRARYVSRVEQLPCTECTTVPKTPCVHQLQSSQKPIGQAFFWRPYTLAWLIKSLTTGDWTWSPDPPTSPKRDWTESSNRLITCLVPLATSAHPQVGSKSHLVHITRRHLYHSHHLGPGFLGAPHQDHGWSPNTHFLLWIMISQVLLGLEYQIQNS